MEQIGFILAFMVGIVVKISLLKFVLVAVTGILISGLIANKIKTGKLKKLSAIIILLVGCWIFAKELMLEHKPTDKTIIDRNSAELISPGIFLLFEE